MMYQRQTKKPTKRGQWYADHDHERTDPALKQHHHQQIDYQKGQEERTGNQANDRSVTEKSGLDLAQLPSRAGKVDFDVWADLALCFQAVDRASNAGDGVL
jgi:hypothetical protein